MTMLKNELYKLFTSHSFLFVIAVSFILCIYSALSADPTGISDNEYKNFYSQTEKMTVEESCSFVEDEIDRLYGSDVIDYEWSRKIQFLSAQKEYFNEIKGYKKYLENIKEQSENITAVSIFTDKNSFTYKNSIKIPHEYEQVNNVVPQIFCSEGILLAIDDPVCDIILLFIAISSAAILTMKERETGIYGLIKPLKYGRRRFALAKTAAVFIISFGGIILVHISSLIIGIARFGCSDLLLPIQSLKGFIACNLPINVAEGTAIILFFKGMTAFLCGIIFMCLFAKFQEITAYISGIAFIISELLAYLFITPSSYFAFWGKINIISFMDCAKIIKMYNNLNVFNTPVNVYVLSIICLFAGIIIAIIAGIKIFSDINVSPIKKAEFNIPFPKYIPKHAFTYSLYKTFIVHKGILIIIILTAVQVYNCVNFIPFYSNDDGYYHYYCDVISGLDRPSAEEFIRSESEGFENMQNMLLSPDADNLNAATKPLEAVNGFAEAKSQFEYLNGLRSENKAMFYETGWKEIFGVNGYKKDMRSALFAVIVLCLVLSSAAANDNRCGIGSILFCTKTGKTRYILHNYITAAIAAVMTAFGVYIPYFISEISTYSADGINFSVRCISEYEHFPDISIKAYLLILFLMRIFILIIISWIITFISLNSRSPSVSFITSAVLLAAPVMLYNAGFDTAIEFCVPLSGNKENISGNYIMFLIYVILAIAAVLYSFFGDKIRNMFIHNKH